MGGDFRRAKKRSWSGGFLTISMAMQVALAGRSPA
jgi:hypothetical protein